MSQDTLKQQLLRVLGQKPRGKTRLPAKSGRGAIPGKKAVGRGGPGTKNNGESISPPLMEIKDTRQFHAVRELKSSDGLFVFTYQPPREIDFVDSKGRRFGFIYQDLP